MYMVQGDGVYQYAYSLLRSDDRAAGPPAKRRDTFGGRSRYDGCIYPVRFPLHYCYTNPRLAGRLGPPSGNQRGRDSDGEGEEPGEQDATKV